MHAPPRDVSAFPVVTIEANSVLYRIHRTGISSWWCCSKKDCRFDLEEPRGTCYGADSVLGCYLETFGEFRIVSGDDLNDRRLVTLQSLVDVRLADVTHPAALGFGIDALVNSTIDYTGPQAWAAAFSDSGFDGNFGIGCDTTRDNSQWALPCLVLPDRSPGAIGLLDPRSSYLRK